MKPPLSLWARLGLSWSAWFRVLSDGAYAARVAELSVPAAPEPQLPEPKPEREPARAPGDDARSGALQLLGLLQREGRLVDFLQQDITSFSDSDVGAAARVVHEGCRRTLRTHGTVRSVRNESEGSTLAIEASEASLVKLTGNVAGKAPYRGVLRHRGWRIDGFELPKLVAAQDLSVLAPAEVEL